MSRFPPVPLESQNDAQKSIEPGIQQTFSRLPQLSYKDDEGNFFGPYASLFYTPELVEPWVKLGGAIIGQGWFTPKERELSVLAVTSVYDAPYVLYAHSEIGRAAGLSEAQVQQAADGEVPSGLSEAERMVYGLSLKLVNLRSRLDQETFDEAERVLGKTRIAGLGHLVTGYISAAMMSNIGDGRIPSPKEGVFMAKRD